MLYILLTAALVVCDQLVKHWTVAHLALGETAPFLPPLIELERVHNYGAAWSSFSGQRLLLIVLPLIIIAAALILMKKAGVRHPVGKLAASLIIAGGIGNLIDRTFTGYVVDMFHFLFWKSYPVFNVADICVVIGAVLAGIYYLWLYEKYDAKKKETADGTDPLDGDK